MQRTSECKLCHCVMSCPPPPWPACKASSSPGCPRRWAGGGSSCILPVNDIQLCLNVFQQNFNIWTAYLFYIFRNWSTRPSAHLYDFLHTETLAEGHRVGEGGVNVVLWGIASMQKPFDIYFSFLKIFCVLSVIWCQKCHAHYGIKKYLMKYSQFVHWLPRPKIL